MAGPLSMVGSLGDSQLCPCISSICISDSFASSRSNPSFRNNGDLGWSKISINRRQYGKLELNSPFIDTWLESRRLGKSFSAMMVNSYSKKQRKKKNMTIVNELGGQYEEGYEDVKVQIRNYFTYKAVRTVLNQLYEMNPPDYRWFYNFIVTNKPGDGKRFLRILGKERRELAERVMVTRLHLYGKWIKKCDHAKMYQEISNENLEILREQLLETVVWPSEDTDAE